MVKCKPQTLDRTFAALSDPTRRALLAQLLERQCASVSDLAKGRPLSLPGVMKHLDVLAEAGLISRAKIGRTVTCRPNPAPIAEALGWLDRYQRFWSERLDRLAEVIEESPT